MRLPTVALASAAVLGLIAFVLTLPAPRQYLSERLPSWLWIALATWRHGVIVDHEVTLKMRDGIPLRASLYLPKGVSAQLPTILIRVPYGRKRDHYHAAVYFARHGYAALVEDMRGTGDSGGELLPWRDIADDGADTLDWIVRQPWSSGKVGTYGCSAMGESQWVLAKLNHPAHRAMIPINAGGAVGSAAGQYSYFGVFEGGIFQLATGFGWFVDSGAKRPGAPAAAAFDRMAHLRNLPVTGLVQSVRPVPNGYDDFLAAPLGDRIWETWGYLTDADRNAIPAFAIETWGDVGVGGMLAFLEAARRANRGLLDRQKVVIGPGNHCQHLEMNHTNRFGELRVENAGQPYDALYLRWFDSWLRNRGDGLGDFPAYTYYMLGENRWLAADQWPPADARTERWHLDSLGKANSRNGDGILSSTRRSSSAFDEFSYDPMDPTPSRGGPYCCTGERRIQPGPADQADVEVRDDVLIYTSPVLERDLRIAGPLHARLTVSSSAPDTDLVARLVHVRPDGKAINIQEGALRLRYRDGFTAPKLMVAGQRYEVAIDMRSIAYHVPRGHRLRLQVTSSSFPRLERNLNTGAPNNAAETRAVVARNRIHHDAQSPSYVELPLLPAAP